MTTAAELAARTECRDLRAKLETAERRIVALEKTKFNLNGLIVARDNRITELEAQIERAHQYLDECYTGGDRTESLPDRIGAALAQASRKCKLPY